MQEEPPVTVSSAARSPNPAAPKRPKKSKKAANQDFDLEDNDNWPEVDVGNLIIDLDADIDKAMSSSSSTATATPSTVAAGQTASTTTTTATVSAASNVPATTSAVSSSAVAATVAPSTASSSTTKLKSLMTSNCNSASSSGGGGGSGSVTQTLTETLSSSAIGSASANDKEKDKSLKMKIKRNKQGASSRHPEGKLEIVKKADGTTSVATAAEPMETNSEDKSRETSPVPNGAAAAAASPASNFIPENTTGTLSAADIVAAAKAAVVKHGGPKAVGGNKVRLTNSSDVKPSNTAASSSKKEGKQNGQQSSSQSSSSSSSTTSETKVHKSYSKSDSGVGGPPAAKRPKVDASVGTEIGTMTEPDCLGPLDPGTSVNLEGIVWNETDGVLVINVTWRGKTYVGTLLDSTRHVNQWAPPRYSESPTSELESRTSKGRGAKRGATRGNSGTPVETETRKNLRSSKSKSKSNLNSPAKRKGRGSDGDEKSGDEKRKRTDSSRNSPDDDEDSEKGDGPTNQGGNESDKDSATSSVKGKDDKDFSDFMPKDKEEEKYIPPPPLPYALVCPKSSCKKRYRQHNGLRFHVSAAHPELLDELGNIRDTSEIERMEKEAKERLNKDSNSNEENTKNGAAAGEAAASTDSSNSGSSSKTSTPGPSDSSQQATDLSTQQPISVPLPPTLKGPPLDAKPIPVSEMGGIPANVRPPPPILQTTAAALPLVARGPNSIAAKPIRPPVNARPIVPATGPQIMPAGSLGAAPINLKPIQPRPAIMADPSPNLALDDLKKAKKQKKMSISPGNSPPRMSNNQNGNSPKVKLADNQKMNLDQNNHPSQNPINNPIAPAARSPAYSDISDDENNDRRQKSSSSQVAPAPPPLPPPPVGAAPGIPAPIPPVTGPAGVFPFGATLPTVPISPVSQPPKEKKEISGPQPGTVEYEKMLLAYGFPPFPYPIPQGMDPNVHIHMLTTNPDYKAKYEKDRTEKEKAFKEQIDRDNREKDRKAGVKLPPPTEADQLGILKPVVQPDIPTNANVEKPKSFSSPMISVKPEFRQDHHNHHQAKKEVKNESSSSSNSKKPEDEGIKATMETRGPPPATPTSFASLMHPALMGRSPFPYDQALLASMPPQILASLYGSPGAGPSQYMQQMQQMQSMQHALGGMRPPFMPPTSNPEDLSRSAALAMAALSSSGSSATKALDLLQQHASQYYAAVGAASSAPPSAVTTTTSSSNPSSHKIHELSERALLKSPVTSHGGPNSRSTSSPSVHRVTPTSMASTLGKSSDLSKRTPSPARTTTPNSSRSRSPPPLRHVHTHTHTHFGVPGLGYHPLMSPSAGVTGPPAAHSPFPPAGFPSHLLPGKPPLPGTLPSFPPPK